MSTDFATAPLTDDSRQAELEEQTDRLLRQCRRPRRAAVEYPFYAPSTLRQISRREEDLSARELAPAQSHPDRATLLLNALCNALQLTEVNRVLLDLARMGLTAAEIGEELELSTKAVRNRLARIVRRLRALAQSRQDLPRQLSEAWDEQLCPERYHPEQHCDPGREACRHDGRCKFRWYLYHVTAEEAEL